MLITVKLMKGLPRLRRAAPRQTLKSAFLKGCEYHGFRMTHYSIQDDHLHFIVEAKDRSTLSRGMQGLLIRVAKGLNRLWGRKGKVFRTRYHDRILRSGREVRNAIVYVLRNAWKHGKALNELVDRFASGLWFGGWKRRGRGQGADGFEDAPVALPRTWLLRKGWRRLGLIGDQDQPRRRRPAGA